MMFFQGCISINIIEYYNIAKNKENCKLGYVKIHQMKQFGSILKTFNWLFVIVGFLAYTLGAVLAVEAGNEWEIGVFLLGLLFFLLLYTLERIQYYLSKSKINIYSKINQSIKIKSSEILGYIFLIFSSLLIITFFLSQKHKLNASTLIWFLLLVLLIMANMFRSFRIWSQPYRWFLEGLCISPVLLFLSSSLQGYPPGKILFFLSLPILFLYLSSALTLYFQSFSVDSAKGTRSPLVVIGWEKTIWLHHILIILAYTTFGFYFISSGSWIIAWPVLLVFCLSSFEIFILYRLSTGMKPMWGLLKATAVIQIVGALYILLFAFLTH